MGDWRVLTDEARLCEDDHHDDPASAKRHAELEPFQDLWHLDEEGRVFTFFGSSAPAHVNLEHMAQQGLRDVQT